MAKKNLTEKTFAKIDDAARAWVKASGGLYRGASGGWIYRVGTRGITRDGVRTEVPHWYPVTQGYGALGYQLLRRGTIARVDGGFRIVTLPVAPAVAS